MISVRRKGARKFCWKNQGMTSIYMIMRARAPEKTTCMHVIEVQRLTLKQTIKEPVKCM